MQSYHYHNALTFNFLPTQDYKLKNTCISKHVDTEDYQHLEGPFKTMSNIPSSWPPNPGSDNPRAA